LQWIAGITDFIALMKRTVIGDDCHSFGVTLMLVVDKITVHSMAGGMLVGKLQMKMVRTMVQCIVIITIST